MALLTLLISALALLISSITGLSNVGAPSEPAPDLGEQATASEATELETGDEIWEYEGYRWWGREDERFPFPLVGQLYGGLGTALGIPYARIKDPCGETSQDVFWVYVGPVIRHGFTEDDPIPEDLLQMLKKWIGGTYTEMKVDPWNVYVYGQEPNPEDERYDIAAYMAYAQLHDGEDDPTWQTEYTAQAWDCSHPRYADDDEQLRTDIPLPPASADELGDEPYTALLELPYVRFENPEEICGEEMHTDYEYTGPPLMHELSPYDLPPEDLWMALDRAAPGAEFSVMVVDEDYIYMYGRTLSEDGQFTTEARAARISLYDSPNGRRWQVDDVTLVAPC